VRTNGVNGDKERRIIDLIYDLNAKVARIDERTKALCKTDEEGRADIDRINDEIASIKNKIAELENELSKFSTYFKLIGTVLGMMLMAMLTQLDKLFSFIKRA